MFYLTNTLRFPTRMGCWLGKLMRSSFKTATFSLYFHWAITDGIKKKRRQFFKNFPFFRFSLQWFLCSVSRTHVKIFCFFRWPLRFCSLNLFTLSSQHFSLSLILALPDPLGLIFQTFPHSQGSWEWTWSMHCQASRCPAWHSPRPLVTAHHSHLCLEGAQPDRSQGTILK